MSIVGALVLLLDILVIVDCLQSPMVPSKKLLWIALILLLPVVGIVLYFLLATRPI